MNKPKDWFLILGGGILLIAGACAGWLDKFGRLPWQCDNLYEDPQGRFTMQIDPSWERVETDGSYTEFKVPDPSINMYMLVLQARTIDDAFSQALEVVGFDPGLLTGGDVTTIGDWETYSQTDSTGLMYGLAGQIVGENAYVMVVKTNRPGIDVDNAIVGRALTSVKITAKAQEAEVPGQHQPAEPYPLNSFGMVAVNTDQPATGKYHAKITKISDGAWSASLS